MVKQAAKQDKKGWQVSFHLPRGPGIGW